MCHDMTKEEIAQKCEWGVYSLWLHIAIRNFNELDPEAGFKKADNFIKELLKQNPEF